MIRDSERCEAWIAVGVIAVFLFVAGIVALTASPRIEHAEITGTDEVARWCHVTTASCENDGYEIMYTWIVNCSGVLGVIADSRPVAMGTCPDVVHPEDSTDRCWRISGVEHRYSWTEHVHTEHHHGHHDADDVDEGAWTTFGWILLAMVLFCVPLACFAIYWSDQHTAHELAP
jgi:hypothetical protein